MNYWLDVLLGGWCIIGLSSTIRMIAYIILPLEKIVGAGLT